MNNSPDLDSYGKPLPPPPVGWYWSRLEDGSWELLEFDSKAVSNNSVVLESPAVIEHVVMPADTLQGLCLRYRVSAVSLRQYNNFSGNAFRSRKSLRIPLEPHVPVVIQQPTEDVLIQKFINMTNEGREEARYYLNEHNWNLMEAIAALNGDTEWFESNRHLIAPPTAPAIPVAEMLPPGIELVAPHAVAYSLQEIGHEIELSEDDAVRIPLLS